MIKLLALIGLVLSLYASYVKIKSKEKNYKALCDVSTHVSCTKAFSSKYGSLIGIPNPFLGIGFYAIMFFVSSPQLLLILSSAAFLISLLLAYLSYVVQKNFCLVCSAIYIINTLLFVLAW